MKTIQVTDEMYNALIELAKEMTTQDNLCTAMPYLFQVKTKEEVAAYPDCEGDVIWVDSDEGRLVNDDEIKDFIIRYLADNKESIDPHCEKDDDELVREATLLYNAMDDVDIDVFLERKEFRKIEVTTMNKYQNAFFTAKGCKEHIRLNNYHYNEPTCYLNHAFRNPEMDLIFKFLCELTK
jgi:hypothetical protein